MPHINPNIIRYSNGRAQRRWSFPPHSREHPTPVKVSLLRMRSRMERPVKFLYFFSAWDQLVFRTRTKV